MILFMTGSLIGESASQDNLNDTLSAAGYDVNLDVTESLPTPLPLRDGGAQARNYVAVRFKKHAFLK